jgi:7-cyano-7-deazaguanine synthase
MTQKAQKPAVVLLSGGLDSATVLAIAKSQGYAPHALSFSYGQRHSIELEAARRVAQSLGAVEHRTAQIDLRAFGGSALTAEIEVPKNRPADEIEHGIPITYVPARNTIFLSYALAFAEVTNASTIFIGANYQDSSGYPDCRPAYIDAFSRVASLATRTPIAIRAPLIDLTKREIISLGLSLGVDYSLTTSCYDPDPTGAACGHCDACQLRLRGFAELGMPDPGLGL